MHCVVSISRLSAGIADKRAISVASVKIIVVLVPTIFFLEEGLGLLGLLRWRASNDTRDHAIIGGVVPNHRSRVEAIQDVVQPSSSKAVGHPLTACLVERYVIHTSYRDNASCKCRRNATLFLSVCLKNLIS